jgi:hypothetical protein
MSDPIFLTIPLWLSGPLLVIACVSMSELGRVARRRMLDGKDAAVGSESQNYIVGAVFGLLAFLISFTFSIAISRFDDRRAWVAEEANAIHTTFLRADMLDDPLRSELQSTLREYAHSRIAPDGLEDVRIRPQLKRSHDLQSRLWAETRVALYADRRTELASYFLESMNQMLDIGTRRELAGQGHIPIRILDALLIYLLVASLTLGFVARGSAAAVRIASTLLFTLFVISFVIILDLDRPRVGSIKVPQDALIELAATLDRTPAQPTK